MGAQIKGEWNGPGRAGEAHGACHGAGAGLRQVQSVEAELQLGEARLPALRSSAATMRHVDACSELEIDLCHRVPSLRIRSCMHA